jgi:hypothetical protein
MVKGKRSAHKENQMRQSATITPEEVKVYGQFCAKHHVFLDGQWGVDNANFVPDYFLTTWQQDLTEANLAAALPHIRPYLKFKTEAEVKLDKASDGMTEKETQIFNAWVQRQRLMQPLDGEQGIENAENIISWVREKNFDFSSKSFDLALSNIINNGHYGHAQLHWKPVQVEKQEREVSDAEIATYRSRAEGVVVRTPSGLVINGKTEKVQSIVVNGADGKIDWKATAQKRELAASGRM